MLVGTQFGTGVMPYGTITKIYCFSIVVDDVDEKCLRVGLSTAMTVTDDDRNSPSPEYTTNRIKEFQVKRLTY